MLITRKYGSDKLWIEDIFYTVHKKWSFPLKVSSVDVTQSTGNGGFGQIDWWNPEWKTSFFVQQPVAEDAGSKHP